MPRNKQHGDTRCARARRKQEKAKGTACSDVMTVEERNQSDMGVANSTPSPGYRTIRLLTERSKDRAFGGDIAKN